MDRSGPDALPCTGGLWYFCTAGKRAPNKEACPRAHKAWISGCRFCIVMIACRDPSSYVIGNSKAALPNSPSHHQAICNSPSIPVLEEAARLANAMVSDRMGRSYLLQREGSGTVPALVAMLKAGAFLVAAAAGSSARDLASAASADAPPAVTVGDLIRQPTPPQKTRSSEWNFA